MKTRLPLLSLIAIALAATSGLARATETAMHNDLDGDGRSDLIWTQSTNGGIYVYNFAKNISFNVFAALPPNLYTDLTFLNDKPAVLAYSDSTFDIRRSALLVRNPSSGVDYSTYPADSNTTGWVWMKAVKFVGTSDWIATGAGDFNGDGVADLLYRNARDGSNKIQSNAGKANWWTTLSLPAVSLSWKVAGIGDFDGDGRSDILWRNMTTGQNSAWRSGNASTKLAISTVSDLNWIVAGIGDFNGDHHSDILWHNTHTGANSIWRSGSQQNKDVLYTVTDLSWKIAGTGDFNGDGKWDVVWRNTATGDNILWKSANRDTRLTLPSMDPYWILLK